jgi:hypothetical protein
MSFTQNILSSLIDKFNDANPINTIILLNKVETIADQLVLKIKILSKEKQELIIVYVEKVLNDLKKISI